MKMLFSLVTVLLSASNAMAIQATCDLKLTLDFKMTTPAAARLASDHLNGTVEIKLSKELPGLTQNIDRNDQLKEVTAAIDAKAQTLSITQLGDDGKPQTTTVPAVISSDFATTKGGTLTVNVDNTRKLFANAIKKMEDDTKKIHADVDLKNSELTCKKSNDALGCGMKITGQASKAGNEL